MLERGAQGTPSRSYPAALDWSDVGAYIKTPRSRNRVHFVVYQIQKPSTPIHFAKVHILRLRIYRLQMTLFRVLTVQLKNERSWPKQDIAIALLNW